MDWFAACGAGAEASVEAGGEAGVATARGASAAGRDWLAEEAVAPTEVGARRDFLVGAAEVVGAGAGAFHLESHKPCGMRGVKSKWRRVSSE